MFTSQLEKSRDSVTISNIRAAYAEASTAMLTSNGKAVAKTGNVAVAAVADGKQVVTVENVAFKGQAAGFSDLDAELPFTHTALTADKDGTPGNHTLTFTYTIADGTCALTAVS